MIFNNNTAQQTAELLLQINAIKLNSKNPFTWASGWKSPIYCFLVFLPLTFSFVIFSRNVSVPAGRRLGGLSGKHCSVHFFIHIYFLS